MLMFDPWTLFQNVLYLLAMMFLAFAGTVFLPFIILAREEDDALAL